MASPHLKSHCYCLAGLRPPAKQRLPSRRQGQRPNFFLYKIKFFPTYSTRYFSPPQISVILGTGRLYDPRSRLYDPLHCSLDQLGQPSMSFCGLVRAEYPSIDYVASRTQNAGVFLNCWHSGYPSPKCFLLRVEGMVCHNLPFILEQMPWHDTGH